MTLIVCSLCEQRQPTSAYVWNKANNRYNSQCRGCCAIEQRRRNSTKEGRVKFCVAKARNRKHICTLTYEEALYLWDLQGGKCALSGAPLSSEGNSPYTASLDRKDSSKGYTADNVQWVCWIVNKMKMEWSQNEFLSWVHAIADNTRN